MQGATDDLRIRSKYVDSLRSRLSLEITTSLGLSTTGWYHWLLERLFWIPCHRFSQLGARFDDWVSRSGFVEAASQLLPDFVSDFRAYGAEGIPTEGPLLIASNHPGIYDALLIAACLGRNDLKIFSSNIPFVRGMRFARNHVVFSSDEVHVRIAALRSALRHLVSGGSLLIFPSGHIDPDPAVLPGSHDALSEWSPSVELMLRRAPDTKVLVTMVSGVLAPDCVRNPLTRIRSRARDRQRLAEFIQVAYQLLFERQFHLCPRVSFAEPMTPAELCDWSGASRVTEALIERARDLLTMHTAADSAPSAC
jgi:hypothetical protein